MKNNGLFIYVSAILMFFCSCMGNHTKNNVNLDSTTIISTDTVYEPTTEVSKDSISPCLKIVPGCERPLGTVLAMLREIMDPKDIYNSHVLYGYWFKPHEACSQNIIFKKDKTFIMRDYECSGNECTHYERTGIFRLKGDSVYMSSEDGWKLNLRYWKGGEDNNKYITLGDEKNGWKFYLVKGSDA